MSNPGAAAWIFAFVFVVHHYRQLLIPALQTVEQSPLARRVAGLLTGDGGVRGHSAIRGVYPDGGGACAPRFEDEPGPGSFRSQVPVSASAREPPGWVAGPAIVVLSPD